MNTTAIKYLTHQVSTNKNSLTEMNHRLQKMETPHNQTTHNKTTHNKHKYENKR